MFSKQIGSRLYFLRRSFSEVVDPQKIAWINKTLQNYKVEDKLAPYKEKIAGDIEYKVLNLPKTATVRQIYTAYTILDKSLKAPDVKNKEVSFYFQHKILFPVL